jgi:acetyltransferase
MEMEPGWLPQEQVFLLLAAYGIPTLQTSLARTADQAARLANEIGYPVVLKIASSQVAHKSDIGGVLLDLRGQAAVLDGYQTVVENSRNAAPGAEVDGVYVQRMVAEGQEVIIGAIQDPDRPLVMFGWAVEVVDLKEHQFSLGSAHREAPKACWKIPGRSCTAIATPA